MCKIRVLTQKIPRMDGGPGEKNRNSLGKERKYLFKQKPVDTFHADKCPSHLLQSPEIDIKIKIYVLKQLDQISH